MNLQFLSCFFCGITLLLFIHVLRRLNKKPHIPFVRNNYYPIVGHLFAFLANRTNFVINCRQRYGQCFSTKILNQKITFLLSPFDWSIIARNRSIYFPGPEFAAKLFNMSPDCFGHPEMDVEMHRYYVEYLQNNNGLRPMVVKFVRHLKDVMRREKMALKSNWMKCGLLQLSHRVLFEPSSLTIFGEINPTLLEKDFCLFDNNIDVFFALLPDWIYRYFFREILKARSRLNNSWMKGNRHRTDECDFIRTRTEFIFDHREWFSEQDFAGAQTALLWASVGNTIPAVFWCFFYILQDSKAMKTIQEEIDIYLPKFSLENDDRNEDFIEQWTPEHLNRCIYLDSAVNEVLRLTSAPMMLRKCCRKTQVTLHDGRILNVQPNDAVALYPAASHYDENQFPYPTKFVFDRFVHRNMDTVHGFMPFGTGKSKCPGRFFAKCEIKICIAMLLRHIECKLVDTEIVPTQKAHRIGVGVAPPTQDLPIIYRYKMHLPTNSIFNFSRLSYH